MSGEKRVNVPKVVSTRRPQHKPKLGQHFLASDSYAVQIVDALGDTSQSTVLEIGPGRGVLTSLLAKRARRLIAVELDRVLAAQLRLRFGMFPNVEVIEADILSVDFDSLFGPKPGLRRPGIEFRPDPVKVVGNLPYYITSDILLRLFDYSKYFETIVILVQREVADRIAAEPGSRDYGLLSATAQLYARVEKLFTLPPTAFAPPPKVHSTVLRLTIAPRQKELGLNGDGSAEGGACCAAEACAGGETECASCAIVHAVEAATRSHSALRNSLSPRSLTCLLARPNMCGTWNRPIRS